MCSVIVCQKHSTTVKTNCVRACTRVRVCVCVCVCALQSREMRRDARRCEEMRGDARRCEEMQGDARRCEEMRGDARRCEEMRGDARRCEEMQGDFFILFILSLKLVHIPSYIFEKNMLLALLNQRPKMVSGMRLISLMILLVPVLFTSIANSPWV